jgi:hypothetical protein
MNNPERMVDRSEQTDNIESLPPEGTSWQNPGKFPSFKGEGLSSETDYDIKRNNRETARSGAEKQYQSELTRIYETDKEGVLKFSIEADDKTIDGYEFVGSDFKMLVSVIGAVGQSLGNQPKSIDLERWVNTPRDYISTSLISDKKINLFDRNGLIFGFNNLNDGDFLSAAPADHGILRDIGKMGQYKDQVMSPDELLESTGTMDNLTPWNEVEINGKTKPDSIIVFGDSRDAISDEAKKAAEFFGIPIYLIRTDIYGKPTDMHDDREVSENVKEFWANRDNPVSGRIEQERNALLEEVKSFFETGEIGGRITKYLGDYEGKLRTVKEASFTKEEFVRNLIAALGQDRIAAIKEQIEDGD